MQLALIGGGQFSRACDMIGSRSEVLNSRHLADVFNYACAEWGQNSVPPKDLFARLIQLMEESRDGDGPNFWQCAALANFVVGNVHAAKAYLERAEHEIELMPPIPIFSCWRFLNVRRKEFLADLRAMNDQAKQRKSLLPRFLEEQPNFLLN
ncbi:hypothetical protein ACQPTN_33225 [Bradyrhizobium sp. 13971]